MLTMIGDYDRLPGLNREILTLPVFMNFAASYTQGCLQMLLRGKIVSGFDM